MHASAPQLAQQALERALAAWREGNAEVAANACREALAADPQRPDAWVLAGVLARGRGVLAEAEAAYRQALALKPDYVDAWFNLGNTLALAGQYPGAEAAWQHCLQLAPDYAPACNALGHQWVNQGLLSAGLAQLRRAVALRPDYAEAHNNFARALWLAGQADEAIASARRAVAAAPGDAAMHSNLLTLLHYSPHLDAAALAAEHRTWSARHVGTPVSRKLERDLSPQRRLRIGYVSPNLRRDAAGCFIATVFAHHDRTRYEVVAYADAPGGDALTTRLRAQAAHWVDSHALSDTAFAAQVEADRLDILVDLTGHTGRNRLRAMARRLAPLQLSWLGYEGSTGVPNIDWLIGDANVTPPEHDRFTSERVMRMPFGFQCWTPPDDAPPVAPPPALVRGELTFGSFNKLAKLNDGVLDLWAALLAELPRSRLLLKCAQLGDSAVRAALLDRLGARGVAPARVELRSGSPYAPMLAEYGEVDIALDPSPFSGGATTLDALWMGVPVLTLRGHRFSANHTVSHLQAAGLPEWIAHSPADYVRRSTQFGRELLAHSAHLAELRAAQRALLADSPLCNGALFTRQLELRLRTLWRQWSKEQGRS